jgi:hypothetical protein
MKLIELESELRRIEASIASALSIGDSNVFQLMRLRDTIQQSLIKYYKQGVSPERLVA